MTRRNYSFTQRRTLNPPSLSLVILSVAKSTSPLNPRSLHPSVPLNIPLHNPHRWNIHLSPLHHVISRRPQKDSPKHGNIPVHRVRLHRRRRREEAKHKKRQEKRQGDDIDGYPRTAQGPARWWQRFTAQALGEDAAYGEDVGAEESGDGEGDDGVKGDGGAKID